MTYDRAPVLPKYRDPPGPRNAGTGTSALTIVLTILVIGLIAAQLVLFHMVLRLREQVIVFESWMK